MKKVFAITCLVTFLIIIISPGYASEEGYKRFKRLVKEQFEISGRPEITVESAVAIIIIFGLKDAMVKFKYSKLDDTYEVTSMPKIDSGPSEWDQEPGERLREALKIY